MSKYLCFCILLLIQLYSYSQNFLNSASLQTNSSINQADNSDSKSNEYLIVFKSPCLIQQLNENSQLKSATIIQPIKSEHDQFASDLWAIRKSNSPTLKSTSIPVLKNELYRTINAVIIESDDEEILKIKALSYVKTVLKNRKVQFIKEPISNESLKSAKNLTLETTTENGEGVKVGILDSGIDYNNPALGGGFGPGFKVAGGYDFVNNDNDPMDDDGHGTSVAGVIAANGELIGIAPKATLYAFKVMNAWGWGWSNNTITALERCVDLNQDNDMSDHLDIVNMSIATYYLSDNEKTTLFSIYKNMEGLNMIVCVAAGNEGPDYVYFNVLSTSEDVLSVGSCNSDNKISSFSCRSFGINNYGIKPDIVALGENVKILSLLNTTYQNGGTSIACPGVAGVATLLKQKHKDWTFNQIKSALISSADDLGFNVMEQGGGKVNQTKALNQTTTVFPQTLNWGLCSENTGILRKTCKIQIFNQSQTQQKYIFDFGQDLPSGIAFQCNSSSIDINPNGSATVTLEMTVDQSKLNYPEEIPYNHYGKINIQGTTDIISVPWTILRGCRIRFKSDIAFSKYDSPILKIWKDGKQVIYSNFFDSTKMQVVPPGKYDILFKATEGELGYPYKDTLKAYLFVKENVEITGGDTDFYLLKKEIKNRILFQSVDANGNAFFTKKTLVNKALENNSRNFFDMVAIKDKTNLSEPVIRAVLQDKYFINNFNKSDKYQLYAGDYKAEQETEKKYTVINYEVSNDINSDVVLKNSPEDFSPYHFIFNPVTNQKCFSGITVGQTDQGYSPPNFEIAEPTYSTLWINRKSEGELGLLPIPAILNSENTAAQSFISTFDFTYPYGDSLQYKTQRNTGRYEFRSIYKNDTVWVNNGLVYYSLNISSRYNYKYFGCYSYLKGMYGERLEYGYNNSSITVKDVNDNVIYQNKVGVYNNEPYTGSLEGAKLEISTSDYSINGKKGKALLQYKMGTTVPSSFTSVQSLEIRNNQNQIRSVFKSGSQAKLRVILDGTDTTNSIKLYFKFATDTEWASKSFTINKNQYNENVLETDISDLLHSENEIDFKIEVEDNRNYKMSYTLEPAIAVSSNKLYNSLSALKNTSNFYIYPNPAKDFITIKNASDIKEITIFDLNGNALINMSQTFKSQDIVLDISFLSPGMYILKTKGNSDVHSEKILKL